MKNLNKKQKEKVALIENLINCLWILEWNFVTYNVHSNYEEIIYDARTLAGIIQFTDLEKIMKSIKKNFSKQKIDLFISLNSIIRGNYYFSFRFYI